MNEVKAIVETITPEIANEYLKANTSNRPLNQYTVDYYADQMKRGQWKLNGEAICFSNGGRMENGQHRLAAIIKSGVPIDILVVRGVESGSFATYDSGRNRSLSDVFNLSEIPDYTNAAAVVNKYIALKKGYMCKYDGSLSRVRVKTTSEDALMEYNEHKDVIKECLSLAKSCYKKVRLLTISEIGGLAAFLVIEKGHQISFVRDFFEMLFFDKERGPIVISLLRDKLIMSKISNHKLSNALKDAIIKKTWNCYATGKDVKVLSYNESKEGRLDFV